ncbi:hypothetical protein J2T10_004173 [Paenarthrobacter nicotinovorans]|uniref:RHS repeat-associated protein n=1 Tax=Paenarthrobacter nicotinovorans TaxID=29320 RepID=A0ABT9TS35_PAENI|nr:hypothetical protein [Paenarthrobacter nicotinovorans]
MILPVTGAFTSADPALEVSNPVALSAYAYSGNDPVNNSDPSGLFVGPGVPPVVGAVLVGSAAIPGANVLVWGTAALIVVATVVVVCKMKCDEMFGGGSSTSPRSVNTMPHRWRKPLPISDPYEAPPADDGGGYSEGTGYGSDGGYAAGTGYGSGGGYRSGTGWGGAKSTRSSGGGAVAKPVVPSLASLAAQSLARATAAKASADAATTTIGKTAAAQNATQPSGNGGSGGQPPKTGFADPGDEEDPIARILRQAREGKGFYGLGSATRAQTEAAGEAWVGPGARLASDGKTWYSADKLTQYRPPSFKTRTGFFQANFESRLIPKGPWPNNGHLDILGGP